MDIQLIENLRQTNRLVQPFLTLDGRCFTLGVSYRPNGDGAVWEARACDRGPTSAILPLDWSISTIFRFDVFITNTAMQSNAWHRHADAQTLDDLRSYLDRLAIAHLKLILTGPFDDGATAQIRLAADSSQELWSVPETERPDQTRRRFRTSLLYFLSDRHAEGVDHMPLATVHSRFCISIDQIEVVLGNLHEQKLVLRTVLPGLRITTEGLRATEDLERPAEHVKLTTIESITPAPPISTEFDIFLSYASQDRVEADMLRQALIALGLKVWFDVLEVPLGASLTAELNKGMSRSAYGVLLISPHYLDKSWPMAELKSWLHRKYSSQQNLLIPIRLNLTHSELVKDRPLLDDIVSGELKGNADELAREIYRAVGKASI